jgi:hypothetical protein
MGESFQGFGEGILKGLKRVLFTASPEESTKTTYPADPTSVSANKTSIPNPKAADNPVALTPFPMAPSPENVNDAKEMKLKVYQLLEQMNKSGVDFFEVWNAAVEMGGANANNLKSAFTSLRFADKSLNKARLIESGNVYVHELQTIFENESKKRKDEKAKIAAEREQVRTGLTSEIENLELQITDLQKKMDIQKQKLLSLDENYNPRLKAIEQKINNGSEAVKSVLAEMQQVIEIINKEIN